MIDTETSQWNWTVRTSSRRTKSVVVDRRTKGSVAARFSRRLERFESNENRCWHWNTELFKILVELFVDDRWARTKVVETVVRFGRCSLRDSLEFDGRRNIFVQVKLMQRTRNRSSRQGNRQIIFPLFDDERFDARSESIVEPRRTELVAESILSIWQGFLDHCLSSFFVMNSVSQEKRVSRRFYSIETGNQSVHKRTNKLEKDVAIDRLISASTNSLVVWLVGRDRFDTRWIPWRRKIDVDGRRNIAENEPEWFEVSLLASVLG